MAGILDNKSRIMDLLMTQEGKRQIAAGDFKPRFASFTDRGTFYDKSSISGSIDSAFDRLYFESSNLPFDSITIEANDKGNVLPVGINAYDDSSRIIVFDGNISRLDEAPVTNATGSIFASYVDNIIRSTTDNFRKQTIIASRDPIDNSDQFLLSTGSISFTYANRGPIIGEDLIPTVDQAPPLFTHKRFANSLNFAYLPPTVKENNKSQPLGKYTDIKQIDKYDYNDIERELIGENPDDPICPVKVITFSETSKTNDICMQAYEINGNSLKKLDIVDYGEVPANDDNPPKRVVFLGKVYVDSYQSPTFANIFTIILE